MRLAIILAILTSAAMCSAQDRVPDAVIDAAISRLKKDPPDMSGFDGIWGENNERWVWNYKRADGKLRSRMLAMAHRYPGSWSPLLPLAAREKGVELRAMAASILAHITHGEDMDKRNAEMLRLAEDPSPRVRQLVAKGLRWGMKGQRTALLKLVKDSNRPVAITAALSLGLLQDTRSLPFLANALGDPKLPSEVQQRREEGPVGILATFGEDAVPHVAPRLKSKSAQVRRDALLCLTRTRVAKVFDFGKSMIHDPDVLVRIYAYQAVGYDRRPEAIPILVEGLKDKGVWKNIRVRASVEDALRGNSNPSQPLDSWKEGIEALKRAQSAEKGP